VTTPIFLTIIAEEAIMKFCKLCVGVNTVVVQYLVGEVFVAI